MDGEVPEVSEPPEADVEDDEVDEDDVESDDEAGADAVLPPAVEDVDDPPDVVPEPPPATVEVCCGEPAVVFADVVPEPVQGCVRAESVWAEVPDPEPPA